MTTETKMMFVTKYSLASGSISERELSVDDTGYARPTEAGYWASFKVGRDAFHSRDEAVIAAKAARDKKVTSLQRQIAKLQKMEFSQ